VGWDQATLDRYLTNPSAVVPHTIMTYGGLKDADSEQTRSPIWPLCIDALKSTGPYEQRRSKSSFGGNARGTKVDDALLVRRNPRPTGVAAATPAEV
jgi:hypothetical protein